MQFRADDPDTTSALVHVLQESLVLHGFSDVDVAKASVSVKELIDNVALHSVDPEKHCGLLVSFVDALGREREVIRVIVMDRGRGFDFSKTMVKLRSDLETTGREHGLLRAYRYGTDLSSSAITSHAVEWKRWKRRTVRRATLGEQIRVPSVALNYVDDVVSVCGELFYEEEIVRFMEMGSAFLRIVFDPIRRSGSEYVIFEVFGYHTTRVGVRPDELIDALRTFCDTLSRPKQLIIYADAEPEDHRFLADYAATHSLTFFEDARSCRKFFRSVRGRG